MVYLFFYGVSLSSSLCTSCRARDPSPLIGYVHANTIPTDCLCTMAYPLRSDLQGIRVDCRYLGFKTPELCPFAANYSCFGHRNAGGFCFPSLAARNKMKFAQQPGRPMHVSNFTLLPCDCEVMHAWVPCFRHPRGSSSQRGYSACSYEWRRTTRWSIIISRSMIGLTASWLCMCIDEFRRAVELGRTANELGYFRALGPMKTQQRASWRVAVGARP